MSEFKKEDCLGTITITLYKEKKGDKDGIVTDTTIRVEATPMEMLNIAALLPKWAQDTSREAVVQVATHATLKAPPELRKLIEQAVGEMKRGGGEPIDG